MKSKYLVVVLEDGQWVDQGDGPLTLKQAERIAREIRQGCGVKARIVAQDEVLS